MDRGLKHGFRLGEAEIDPLHGAVHGPRGVSLVSPHAMNFLMTLADDPGAVVERETLLEHLQVKSSEELERCRVELQTALGDSPQDPRYVRRVGDGYQLIAPVSIDVPPEPTTAQIL